MGVQIWLFNPRKALARASKSAGQGDSKRMVLCRLLDAGNQDKSVQRLARKAGRHRKGHFFLCGFRPGRLAGAAIGGIADQGVAEMGEVDADLVGASGFSRHSIREAKGRASGPNRSNTR